ncbi:glycosyltransferase family 2 protein [Frigidibacter sp. MR17.24]|uniref:glycosyltransferase family 2 protein n=1 Tax=Frigidibacter sp. MR17.24 TaxID=3127345 RepID=UPI003012A026
MSSTTVASPVISVVVPCYNSGWSVGDTLLSIRAQSFRDFEIILIDDGSTEDLSEALASHRADPRLRVVRQENRGLAGARNRGLAEARAGYVAFIDADDLWHPDFLSRSLAALRADLAAPYAFALCFHLDERNRYLAPSVWEGLSPRHDLIGLVDVNLVGNGSASLFRTDAVRAAGGFDETLRLRGATGAEDWKLCLQMAALGRPAMLGDPLVGYRRVLAGMSQGDPRRQMRSAELVIADLAPLLPQVPRRSWRNARLIMAGWLVPAYHRAGLHLDMVLLMAGAYLADPLFLLSVNVRLAHRRKLRQVLDGLLKRVPDQHGQPVAALREPDGRRPFAFLGPSCAAGSLPVAAGPAPPNGL